MSTSSKTNSIITAAGFVGDITGGVTGNVIGNLTGLALQGADIVAATSGAVVVPVTTLFSSYTTNATAAIAATLADGVAGQMKIILLTAKVTNNMVVTFNSTATLTFDATGEVAILVFNGTDWVVIYTTATLA